MTTEKAIEKKYRESVKNRGGLALKFVSPGFAGVPDRIALFPGGQIEFVELKAPGKKPTARQLAVHEQFRKLGFTVRVVDGLKDIPHIDEKAMSQIVRKIIKGDL